jgi:carboxyl-terminal processing protease
MERPLVPVNLLLNTNPRFFLTMFKKLISYSFGILIFIASSACAGNDSTSTGNIFAPTEQQKITYQTSLQFVSAYHYSRPQINDEFSEKALANYIEMLDPSKVYFLQEDINRFNAYKDKLDDGILTGDVQPAFDIFNVYQKRMLDRIDYALTLLKRPFDFTQNDSFQLNRDDKNVGYAANFTEYDKLWQQKVKYEYLLTKAGKPDSADKYIGDVRKRYENLLKFANKSKGDDVFQLFMNAILEVTDPHTNYFSPRSAEDFNQTMSLSLEGIGAQLQVENEYIKIKEIIKGGPADKSKKLFAGDKIIGVAQGKDSDIVNIVDWRIDDAVSLIRGKKGTPVRLKIIPADEPNTTRIVDLVREKIVLEDQSAKSSVKEINSNGKKMKIGVVTIPNFYLDFAAASRGDKDYKSTTRDVKKLIADLKKQKIDGLIIDLRYNGGGSLQEAIELTGLFIKTGPVVQVRHSDGSVKVEKDFDPEIFYDGPLTVMVNRFSASASEIFAAAVQDYHRGIIVGERTYGKGTVQQLADLNDVIAYNGKKLGQVKLTIAKFYRVNGGSTQHKGVTPDILFKGIYDDDEYGEDGSPYALPWDQIPAANIEMGKLTDANLVELKTKHDNRITKEPEYKYLMEDITLLDELRNQKYISLNEASYKRKLENDAELKKKREEARKSDRKQQKDKPDLILEESEQVIIDLLTIK